MSEYKQRMIEIFEKYDASIEKSPNYKWIQMATELLGRQTAEKAVYTFVPFANIDGELEPMVGERTEMPPGANDPKTEKGFYGAIDMEGAIKIIEKNKKYPGWKDAESFHVKVYIDNEVLDVINID